MTDLEDVYDDAIASEIGFSLYSAQQEQGDEVIYGNPAAELAQES